MASRSFRLFLSICMILQTTLINRFYALEIEHVHEMTYIQVEEKVSGNDNPGLNGLAVCNTSGPIAKDGQGGRTENDNVFSDLEGIPVCDPNKGNARSSNIIGSKFSPQKTDRYEPINGDLFDGIRDFEDTDASGINSQYGKGIRKDSTQGVEHNGDTANQLGNASYRTAKEDQSEHDKVNSQGVDHGDRNEHIPSDRHRSANGAQRGLEKENTLGTVDDDDETRPNARLDDANKPFNGYDQTSEKHEKLLGFQSALGQDGLNNFASSKNSQMNIDQNQACNPLTVLESKKNFGVEKDMNNKETKIETNLYFPKLQRRSEDCPTTQPPTTTCETTTTPYPTTTTTTTPCPTDPPTTTTTTTTPCPTTTTTTTTTTTPCPTDPPTTTTTTTPCPTTTTTTTTTPCPTDPPTTTCETTTTTTPCPTKTPTTTPCPTTTTTCPTTTTTTTPPPPKTC